MPKRVQRQRAKGWRKPQGAVYVGRGSKFGNPFDWRLGTRTGNDPREDAVVLFRNWLKHSRGPSAPTDADIASLRGKTLMCWCPLSSPCHADVLLELANGRNADVGTPSGPSKD
jgi:hypothetical protein